MKTLKSLILFLLIALQVQTMAQKSVQGEYYFNRQEMAAGFNFSQTVNFSFSIPMGLLTTMLPELFRLRVILSS